MNKILNTNYLLMTMISIIILGLVSCDSNVEDIDVKLEKYFEDESIIKYRIFDDDDYITVLSKREDELIHNVLKIGNDDLEYVFESKIYPRRVYGSIQHYNKKNFMIISGDVKNVDYLRVTYYGRNERLGHFSRELELKLNEDYILYVKELDSESGYNYLLNNYILFLNENKEVIDEQ